MQEVLRRNSTEDDIRSIPRTVEKISAWRGNCAVTITRWSASSRSFGNPPYSPSLLLTLTFFSLRLFTSRVFLLGLINWIHKSPLSKQYVFSLSSVTSDLHRQSVLPPQFLSQIQSLDTLQCKTCYEYTWLLQLLQLLSSHTILITTN